MKLYCNKCYAKTEYKFSKPKFCPECGEKVLSSVSSQTFKPQEKPKEEKPREEKIEKVLISKNESAVDVDEDYDNEQDLEDDYVNTQKHIENFKRNRRRTGVVVEKSDFNTGISFGELMQKSSSAPDSSKDFQNLNTLDNSKTRQQILDELKAESSSQARVIEIE